MVVLSTAQEYYTIQHSADPVNREKGNITHIGLLEADEDKIRKIRPKGTHVRMLYVPREVDLADGQGERSDPSLSARSTSLGTYSFLT